MTFGTPLAKIDNFIRLPNLVSCVFPQAFMRPFKREESEVMEALLGMFPSNVTSHGDELFAVDPRDGGTGSIRLQTTPTGPGRWETSLSQLSDFPPT